MKLLLNLLLAFLFVIPGASLANDKGEALYTQHCAACHGYDGDGGVGVPLALPDFQYSVTDDFLKKTIRYGRPGRVMPSFPSLSEQELEQLVKYIRRWAPGKPFVYPKTAVKGNLNKGKELYQQRCAACHGSNGEGGSGTGVTFSRPRDLEIIAPALNNPGFLKSASDQFIKATLMNGREGTPMVSFLKHGLSEQDINDLVVYVRDFENHPIAEAQPLPDSDSATMVFESPYDLETTVRNIKSAVVGKNFRMIREQNMDSGLVAKDKENPNKRILYFCNFSLLNKALALDPRVGLFLPCRITVIKENDTVKVYAINPKRLSVLFNNAELNRLCTEMNDTYLEIIEEATL